MSHFTVLVVGPKTAEEIEDVLHPYWELDLDRESLEADPRSEFCEEYSLEEAKKKCEKFLAEAPTSDQVRFARKELLKLAPVMLGSAKLRDDWEPINKKRFDKWLKENKLDNFYVRCDLTKDTYASVENYMEEHEGYYLNRERTHWGYYRNPNSYWDWYQIGGRWAGYFRLKEGTVGVKGTPSLMLGEKLQKSISREPLVADMARKKDIDWEGMILENSLKSKETWKEAFEKYPIVEDKEQNKKNESNRDFMYGIKKGQTEEEYINYNGYFSTFAVIKDGKWYQKGDMGWWGVVSNEKDANKWDKEFSQLIEDLDEDTMLTLVDCHI
jgi:hypothetical protein